MSARSDAFTVSGPGVDRGFPEFGVALSFAVTCASRLQDVASFYVRNASGDPLGRADGDGDSVLVWRFDPRPGDVRDRQLAAASARPLEAGPSGSGVQQRMEAVMAANAAKKKTASRSSARSTSRSGSARKASARKTTSAAKVSPSPARATATTPAEKKMTAAQSQAVSILTKHGGEMKVSELAAAVVSSGKVKLSGKTPAATVGAQIYTAAKAGRWFRKTKRGHVALLAGASAAS